jgi:hypothetical protein
MIDSCVMNIEYMAYKNVITLGSIVNKIPKKVSYHTPDKIKEYATKFFESYSYTTRFEEVERNGIVESKIQNNKISLYGFVMSFEDDNGGSCATSCAVSCALKPNQDITQFDLEMVDSEWIELSQLLKAQTKAVNFDLLFQDVDKFWKKLE